MGWHQNQTDNKYCGYKNIISTPDLNIIMLYFIPLTFILCHRKKETLEAN